MPNTIRDGGGSSILAKVNNLNRLLTNAVTQTENSEALVLGNAYNINTGVINLSDDVETPVVYFKNNETLAIHVTSIVIGLGPTTGGTGGIPKITVVRNPTVGTIVSSPVNVDINSNRNFGSSNSIDVNAYKGATGKTMTDGTDHIIFFQTTNGRLFATIDEILGQGNSIGIKIDPQTSNTSMDAYVALICHLNPED